MSHIIEICINIYNFVRQWSQIILNFNVIDFIRQQIGKLKRNKVITAFPKSVARNADISPASVAGKWYLKAREVPNDYFSNTTVKGRESVIYKYMRHIISFLDFRTRYVCDEVFSTPEKKISMVSKNLNNDYLPPQKPSMHDTTIVKTKATSKVDNCVIVTMRADKVMNENTSPQKVYQCKEIIVITPTTYPFATYMSTISTWFFPYYKPVPPTAYRVIKLSPINQKVAIPPKSSTFIDNLSNLIDCSQRVTNWLVISLVFVVTLLWVLKQPITAGEGDIYIQNNDFLLGNVPNTTTIGLVNVIKNEYESGKMVSYSLEKAVAVIKESGI